ncbi:MAG TPA: sigma-70 family RNA polymerase sigma factor [Candidatus Baltobacteraceae bacterium]|nr:sigma-70 family RNA polymerase sigma factor [Candidatus Baltobacteraceae bacterium]
MIASDPVVEFWLHDRTIENRDRLVLHYRYLCARGARKFSRPGLDRADLRQIAAIGLLKACDRYEPALQTPFEAYAWLFIVGELMHFVRDQERLIRAPRRLKSLEQRVHSASETLRARLGREPLSSEIAAYVGVSPCDVDEVSQYRERAVVHSLDFAPAERTADPGCEIEVLHATMLMEEALTLLSGAEQEIVKGIYSMDLSQGEIAERLGYSRRHISRLHRSALRKMREIFVRND